MYTFDSNNRKVEIILFKVILSYIVRSEASLGYMIK